MRRDNEGWVPWSDFLTNQREVPAIEMVEVRLGAWFSFVGTGEESGQETIVAKVVGVDPEAATAELWQPATQLAYHRAWHELEPVADEAMVPCVLDHQAGGTCIACLPPDHFTAAQWREVAIMNAKASSYYLKAFYALRDGRGSVEGGDQ